MAKKGDNMLKRVGIGIAILVALMTIGVKCSSANSIGVNFGQSSLDGIDIGVTADYETTYKNVDLEAEGNAQKGDSIEGNLDLAATFPVWKIGVRVENKNTFTGYSLDTIGRDNTLGLGLVVPIKEVDVSVIVFGSEGNPFLPVWELSNPNDPNSAVLKDSGLTIKDEATLNAAIGASLNLSIFEVDVRAIVELLGKGERVDKVDIDIGTGAALSDNLDWVASVNIVGQKYGNLLEYQSNAQGGVVYKW